MPSTDTPTWIHITQASLGEVPGSYEVVRAINNKYIHAFTKALEDYPQARTETDMELNSVKGRKAQGVCSPARACVYMGWIEGIDALHNAGVSFNEGHLRLALKKRLAPCVRKLLSLGVPMIAPNGNPAWLDIRYNNVLPDKWAVSQRIFRSFLNAGASPWDPAWKEGKSVKGQWTALEERLNKGQLDIICTGLDYAIENKLPYPGSPDEFWHAFANAMKRSMQHASSTALLEHVPVYQQIMEKAQRAGVVMTPQAPHTLLTMALECVSPQTRHALFGRRTMSLFSSFIRQCIDPLLASEKEGVIQAIGTQFLGTEISINDEEKAHWQRMCLDGQTASPTTIRSTPRL